MTWPQTSQQQPLNAFGLPDLLPAGSLNYGSGMSFGQPAETGMGVDTNALLAMLTKRGEPLTGFAKHANTFGTIADGLAGLGGMYLGYQNMKQQKKAFEFNKGVTNTNLNNSIMDYNRRLEGTLQNRALNNGQGAGWVSSELSRFSAKRS